MSVEEVREDGEIWHWGRVEGREPKPDEEAEMHIDVEWRQMMCEQHTAQHLFSAILEKDHALPTTGFSILADRVKIEVPVPGELSPALIGEAEWKTRLYIARRLPVRIYWENEEQRIVEIPGLDVNPCGGLHVQDTGYIGCFAVLRFYRKNRDFWRIEFVAGKKLESIFKEMMKTTDTLRSILGKDLVEAARRCVQKKEELEKEMQLLKEELLNTRTELLAQETQKNAWGETLIRNLPYGIEELRMLARKIGERGISCVLTNGKGQVAFVSQSPSWGEKVMALLREYGFRGTSTPHFAQGKIEDTASFLDAVRNMTEG